MMKRQDVYDSTLRKCRAFKYTEGQARALAQHAGRLAMNSFTQDTFDREEATALAYRDYADNEAEG